MFAELHKIQGERGIDILFNNAGTNWSESVSTYPMKGWDKVYAVNVRGVFNVTQKALPLLESAANTTNRRSVVVNISSIEGISSPSHDTYAYSSGKAAVAHLTRVMAGRFGMEGKNVNVNAILPGPFVSRMMKHTLDTAGEETVAAMTAVGQIGSPLDMAGVAIYFGSRAGEFVSGCRLVVDGGTTVMPSGFFHPSPQPLPKL